MTDTIKEPIKEIINRLISERESQIIKTDLIEGGYVDSKYHIICDKIKIEKGKIYVILATNKEQNPVYLIRLPSDSLNELYSIYDESAIRIEISDDNHIFWMFGEDRYADITKEHMCMIREEGGQLKVTVAN